MRPPIPKSSWRFDEGYRATWGGTGDPPVEVTDWHLDDDEIWLTIVDTRDYDDNYDCTVETDRGQRFRTYFRNLV